MDKTAISNSQKGKSLRSEMIAKSNDIAQIASIVPYTRTDGKSAGLKMFDVTTGGGLNFSVLESKCLDIHKATFKGINLSFLSKAGLAGPEYFDPFPGEFVYNFQGGLLYTCGLSNVGPANTEGGRSHPLHGRINNSPAENTAVKCEWTESGDYVMEISGTMRQAGLFNENLILSRTIKTKMNSKMILIEDTAENAGYSDQALMLLYHCNFGYPLLDEGTRFVLAGCGFDSKPRDANAEVGFARFGVMEAPVPCADEHVFYHIPDRTAKTAAAALINDRLGLGVYVRFDPAELPVLTQWKSFASGDYAMGIEPANCRVGGRDKEMASGNVEYLKPFAVKKVTLEIGVLEGSEEIKQFEGQSK